MGSTETYIQVLIWTFLLQQAAAQPRCSGKYNFGIGMVDIIRHRSLKKDTIYGSAALMVSNGYHNNVTYFYGRYGNREFDADILFENVTVSENDTVTLSYVFVNNGHKPASQVGQEIGNAVIMIASQGVQIASNVIGDSVAEDVGAEVGRIIGFVLGEIVGWLTGIVGNTIVELVTEGCDGYLAGNYHVFSGADVCNQVVPLSGVDMNAGMPDQKLLGFIPGLICSIHKSLYNVSWYVE